MREIRREDDLSPDMELLGLCLSMPPSWLRVRSHLAEEYFSDPLAVAIYKILVEADRTGFDFTRQSWDLANLVDAKLSLADRIDYAMIASNLPVASNVEYWLSAFKNHAAERIAKAMRKHPDEDQISFNRRIIDEVSKVTAGTNDEPSADDVDASWEIETEARLTGKFTKTPSGFAELDKILGGFQPGRLYVLGARPSMGKTALAINFAAACMEANQRLVFATVEMTPGEIYNRFICREARVNAARFDQGSLSDAERDRIAAARQKIRKGSPNFMHKFQARWDVLRGKLENAATMGPIGLCVVDHLHLMASGPKQNPNPTQDLAIITGGLKQFALSSGVPVLLVCQLSRRTEQGFGDDNEPVKVPTMADLRGSGSIEQDADVVMFVHRDDYRAGANLAPTSSIFVAKNRHGPTGRTRMVHKLEFSLFEDLT